MKIMSSPFDYIDSSVKSVFETAVAERVHSGGQSGCKFDSLAHKARAWQNQGSVVVFTAGVFDILHTTHLLALTHYRLLGACEYLSRNNQTKPAIDEIQEVAASDNVRLIVSVDTDARVMQDKGFSPDKGNCPKPLVSWSNRTLLLARQYMSGLNGAYPLIDFITSHGEDFCSCESCPHDDNALIALNLNPDLVIVNSQSSKTLQVLRDAPGFSDCKIIAIDEERLQYHDDLLGGPIKSSQIIQRARLSSL